MSGEVATGRAVEDLLRELAPRVLGALVRRYGHFDACEDAVQEALLAAAVQWPDQGIPYNPRGWLITVASRRLTDEFRSEQARQRREDTGAPMAPAGELPARASAPARRAAPPGCLGAPAPRRAVPARPGRHLAAAVPVLPSGTVAGVAGGADPAGRWRADDRADRPGVHG